LDRLRVSLKACSNPFHKYYNALSRCPLCEIEAKSGIILFNYTGVIAGREKLFNITAVINEIRNVQGPGKLPPISSNTPVKLNPDKEYLSYRNKRTIKRALSSITIIAGASGIFFTGIDSAGVLLIIISTLTIAGSIAASGAAESRKMLKKARTALYDAGKEMDICMNQWNSDASDSRFYNLRSELLKLVDQYNELAAKGQKMVSEAEENIRKYQLEKFLDSFRIYDANIEKINHTRKATLQSYGIETAADIDPRYIAIIPGFSSKCVNNLLEWRSKVESRFVFNPNKGVDRFQLAEIHKKINEEKFKLENELSKGAAELKRIVDETINARNILRQKIEKAQHGYAKAEENLKCCR
jgi:DNA-binding helix-hairpin-helix protein with protein kinase domain